MTAKRIVVLISGNGSNLQALIDAQIAGDLNGEIVAVLSNKADAFGLQRAAKHNIDALTIDHKQFSDRQAFDLAMLETINQYQPDLLILAGFMRILSKDFVNCYAGKLLNIHPSLLPKYPGLKTHQKALEHGDDIHGSSVHFVTEELDGGPVIAQAKMPLDHQLNEQMIAKQVQQLEYKLYPQVAQWFLTDRLTLQRDGVYFDQKQLQQPIEIA
jgi:phosphoribosylglycinamide formyltransferase 1